MIEDYLIGVKREINELNIYPRELEIDVEYPIAIIGPRRSGKSFYLYYLIKKLNLKEDDYLFVNFEEYEIKNVNFLDIINKHIEIYKKEPKYIFLDEIQNLNNWQDFLYSLVERKKYKIIITGSSSKLLSKEVATNLRGRFISKILLPLSFREYLSFKKVNIIRPLYDKEISKIKGYLYDYLKNGGFPDIILEKVNKKEFIKEYIDILLYKDFIERYKIENIEVARFLLYALIQSNSKILSVNKIYNQLKQITRVSNKTVRKYIYLFPETLSIFLLKKFSYSIKKTYLSQPKIYLSDISLDQEENGIGRKMENIVFLEFIRQNLIDNIYYFHTNEGYEIDFLIKEGNNIKQLIQVSYINNYDEIDKREIRSLLKGYNLFNKPELLIITWDYEDTKIIDNVNIKFIPLYKWLLNI
ncbi:AAA+ superfamily ATPase [Nanobdella aerobiophila]|uniref:AAA+ superfamily ATPase n=1 Tax=Nanobdella aerobiophila TaxID=2586965 RepID=A0A915SKH9_9ARCH|nr:ATP-binding protein [Nanobdella aerobiophila]BBL45346.1 AAA+ superfamily ATPase [Nanobdella aerobiophila]